MCGFLIVAARTPADDIEAGYSSRNQQNVRARLLNCARVIFLAAATTAAAADEIATAPVAPDRALAEELQLARNAVAAARDAGNVWLETPRLLRAAGRAEAAGETARALALSRQARRQAALALNQAYLERARYLLGHGGALESDTRAAVRSMLAVHDGAGAIAALERAGITP